MGKRIDATYPLLTEEEAALVEDELDRLLFACADDWLIEHDELVRAFSRNRKRTLSAFQYDSDKDAQPFTKHVTFDDNALRLGQHRR